MKHAIVLYQSKYGSAKKYAEWIKNSLSCELAAIKDYRGNLNNYEVIIFAGGIYAGGIDGIRQLKKLLGGSSQAAVLIFATGASPYDEKAIEELKKRNLKDFPVSAALFYGRGIYDESMMSFKDRTMCRMLRKSLMKKDPKTFTEPWMLGLVESQGEHADWMDQSFIEPLLAFVENILSA